MDAPPRPRAAVPVPAALSPRCLCDEARRRPRAALPRCLPARAWTGGPKAGPRSCSARPR
eukprot:1844076-Pyramimonas_sp.AAC.1